MLFGLAATKKSQKQDEQPSQQRILGELGTMRITDHIAPRERATSPSNQKKPSNRGKQQ